MMNSGRLRRGRMTASMCAFVRMGAPAPVAVMTMSLAPSTASISSHGAALAPPIASAVRAACAIVRLTMVTCCTPCDFMCCAVSLPISPAPMTSTLRPLRSPKILRASATAAKLTETAPDAESGFGADALAGGERRVEQPVEHRADRLRAGGERVRFLDLAENLRLADDQRIEAGGDAEQVAGGVEVGQVVQVRRELAAIDAVELADEGARDRRAPPRRRRTRRTPRRDCRWRARPLRGSTPRAASARSARLHAPLEVDPLTQFDGRGAMTEADDENVHTDANQD